MSIPIPFFSRSVDLGEGERDEDGGSDEKPGPVRKKEETADGERAAGKRLEI